MSHPSSSRWRLILYSSRMSLPFPNTNAPTPQGYSDLQGFLHAVHSRSIAPRSCTLENGIAQILEVYIFRGSRTLDTTITLFNHPDMSTCPHPLGRIRSVTS